MRHAGDHPTDPRQDGFRCHCTLLEKTGDLRPRLDVEFPLARDGHQSRGYATDPALAVACDGEGHADASFGRGQRNGRDSPDAVEPLVERHALDAIAAPAHRPVAQRQGRELCRQTGLSPGGLVERAVQGDLVGRMPGRNGGIEPIRQSLIALDEGVQRRRRGRIGVQPKSGKARAKGFRLLAILKTIKEYFYPFKGQDWGQCDLPRPGGRSYSRAMPDTRVVPLAMPWLQRRPALPDGKPLRVVSDYQPAGDQPGAIRQLIEGIRQREHDQVLLGVTGSGKTFTMANVIQAVNRPTLVLAPNKTLAAQIYGEMKGFFPDNAVEYFVSYYDYYQPEAYVPRSDTYRKDCRSTADRPHAPFRDARADGAQRRGDRRFGLVHLRHRPARELPAMTFRLHAGERIDRAQLLRRLTRSSTSATTTPWPRHLRARGARSS